MNKSLVRRLLVALATLATIVVNALANIVRYNGYGTGEVSDLFDNAFVPAGYVFAIWGVIYLGLILYTIYQFMPAQADNPRLKAIAPFYITASVANCVWLFLWHYLLLPATMAVMVVILVLLLIIYLRLQVGFKKVWLGERWLVHVPFSIYLGWISVATIANASAWLSQANWSGFGISAMLWAVIMMAVAVVLAVAMALIRRDVAYNLVIIWALVGIGVNKQSLPFVSIPAFVLAGLTLVILVLVLVLRKESPQLAEA